MGSLNVGVKELVWVSCWAPLRRGAHGPTTLVLLQVEFTMSENTTLADLLQLNLHKFEEEVRGIVDKATKEAGMEKVKGAELLPCFAGPLCQCDSVAAVLCSGSWGPQGAHRARGAMPGAATPPSPCFPQGLGLTTAPSSSSCPNHRC